LQAASSSASHAHGQRTSGPRTKKKQNKMATAMGSNGQLTPTATTTNTMANDSYNNCI